MVKILEAECEAGIVTAEGLPVPGTDVLSNGVGASEGALLLDGEKRVYIPDTTPDLEEAIEKLIDVITSASDALTQIATSLTAIGAVPTPVWVPPPTIPADVVIITAKVAELAAVSVELTALKETLK